jgi:hypothetical protein
MTVEIKQPWTVRLGAVIFITLFVGLAAVAFFITELHKPNGSSLNGANAATAVLGIGAFLVGYSQWRIARHEISMEHYYERLETANEARKCLRDEQHKIDPMDMYIFVELDNLEYVLQKYKLGYMTPEQAWRGVKTFRSRLSGVVGFRERLREFPDLVKFAGYHYDTERLVQRLIRE